MAYTNADSVAALCRNLLSSATQFGSSTSPTIYEVEGWLSSGCAAIELRLAAAGYDVPLPFSTAAWDYAAHLNTLYAAAYAEMSRANVVLGPGERTRGQQFLAQFKDGLEMFIGEDLTSVGVSRTSRSEIYVGGISNTAKNAQITDTDRVTPRFFRGMSSTPSTDDILTEPSYDDNT